MTADVRLSVMFVDDEPLVLRSIARLLETAPLEVLTAGSGAEALRVLEQRPVDVLVADFDMPQMTGLELLGIVRQRYPGVVRMVLTGNATVERAMVAINEGEVARLFEKPFDGVTFRQTLVAFADRIARQRREGADATRQARRRELLEWAEAQAPGLTARLPPRGSELTIDLDALRAEIGHAPGLWRLLELADPQGA